MVGNGMHHATENCSSAHASTSCRSSIELAPADAFAAGLIHALLHDRGDVRRALDWAVCASCLKHSISGDFNLVRSDEVAELVAGNSSGRIRR